MARSDGTFALLSEGLVRPPEVLLLLGSRHPREPGADMVSVNFSNIFGPYSKFLGPKLDRNPSNLTEK